MILDTNTSIMGADDLLAEIERYVRDGGIFITTGQSGRHSPSIPDSWPICALSGFHHTRC